MSLPHRLIIDGVEQCASDDKKEFLRMAYLYLGDLEKEFAETGPLPEWLIAMQEQEEMEQYLRLKEKFEWLVDAIERHG